MKYKIKIDINNNKMNNKHFYKRSVSTLLFWRKNDEVICPQLFHKFYYM